jgi:uncharacterized protein YutE (UPF0331/DUF86 family)
MSGFQLTASLVSSLVWPIIAIAVLIFIWVRRNDVGRLFNSRTIEGRTLRRVRAGPVELKWEQLIETTAEKVPESPAVVSVSSKSLRQELVAVADSAPAAAVLEAFARLERRLRELYEKVRDEYEVTLRGDYPPRPTVMRMVRILAASGMISEETQVAIQNLTRLRNEAAHRVGEADITTGQAYEYLELVDRVLDYLKNMPDGSTG